MKRLFLLAMLLPLLVCATDRPDGTILGPGPVSGYLNSAGSPYIVVGDIYVPENYILDIYEGVEVIFDGPYSFDVFGYIRAWGTPDEMITFTSSDPATGWKGIHLLGDGNWGNVTSMFSNCNFSYGRAEGGSELWDHSGGALYVDGLYPLLILNCRFNDNFALGGSNGTSAGGGALAIVDCELASTVIVNECIFQENSCDHYGGAIGLMNSNPEFTQNDISANTAMSGGALYFTSGSDAFFRNNSMLGNIATLEGGAIYCMDDSDPVFLNSIIWGNSAQSGDQIFLADVLSDPDIKYNCLQMQTNCMAGPGSGFNYNGVYGNNTYRQPLCIQSANGSHQLTLCSSCIDSGDPDIAWIDPDGTRNDIGASYFDHVGTYIQSQNINGALSLEGAPYWLNTSTLVPQGQTLVVEAGVEMKVLGRHELKVEGKLSVEGTEEDPVLMTAYNQNIGWKGVRFLPGSLPGKIDHGVIEYAIVNGGEEYLDNKGGGVTIIGNDRVTLSHTVIRNCKASGEETGSNTFSGGAGIYIEDASPLIRYCEITDNLAGDFGGGIAVVNASPIIHHTLIARNTAEGQRGGGGIYVSGVSNPKFTNLTITGNTAPLGGGYLAEEILGTMFRNTILAYNEAEEGHEVYLWDDACDPHFYYCDIIGSDKEFAGPGMLHYSGDLVQNIDADPLFKADTLGMYNLLYASPCRDAGDPHSRTDPDGTRSEIGAYYFPTMAQGQSGNNGHKDLRDDLSFQCSAYPNPCIGNTRIFVELPAASSISVKVYNSAGQEVWSIPGGFLEAGRYEWSLNMESQPKGIYYARVTAGNEIKTIKLIH